MNELDSPKPLQTLDVDELEAVGGGLAPLVAAGLAIAALLVSTEAY